MVDKIISGGQTGADKGGLEAGRLLGLETGGYAPRGYTNETGYDPSLKEYGLNEMGTTSLPVRTQQNIKWSDGTIVFLNTEKISRGSGKTVLYCRFEKWWRGAIEENARNLIKSSSSGYRPVLVMNITFETDDMIEKIRNFIELNNIKTLNIAGSRESTHTGIQTFVRGLLMRALKI